MAAFLAHGSHPGNEGGPAGQRKATKGTEGHLVNITGVHSSFNIVGALFQSVLTKRHSAATGVLNVASADLPSSRHIIASNAAGNVTFTLPTPAALVAYLGEAQVLAITALADNRGTSFRFIIDNQSATYDVDLAGPAGVVIGGAVDNTAIPPDTCKEFEVIVYKNGADWNYAIDHVTFFPTA